MWQEYISLAYGFAIAACVAVLGWRWAWRWWKYRDLARLAREPRCGTCGYILARGTAVICPECGSDVRERGSFCRGFARDPVGTGLRARRTGGNSAGHRARQGG